MNHLRPTVHLSHSLRQAGMSARAGSSLLGTLVRTVGRVLPQRLRRRSRSRSGSERDESQMDSPCL
ncbi:MAG: hypothetical protein RL375_3847 [Pseudomonadota bacterium]|jgi:hypothetical protein